jgi:hypothetical protein
MTRTLTPRRVAATTASISAGSENTNILVAASPSANDGGQDWFGGVVGKNNQPARRPIRLTVGGMSFDSRDIADAASLVQYNSA